MPSVSLDKSEEVRVFYLLGEPTMRLRLRVPIRGRLVLVLGSQSEFSGLLAASLAW